MLKNTIKKSCHLSHWCIFYRLVSGLFVHLWNESPSCAVALPKNSSHLISSLSLFCSPSLCPVSMDPGRRMGRWYCTIGRRWSTERMATAGRRGKTGRPHERITWSWKCRELRWVGWQRVWILREWTGKKRRGGGGRGGEGYGSGESQPSPWHRQTQVYSELSPGCNGDSHMLLSPRSFTKKQCSTTIVFPGKPVEWNRLFVPY